MKLNHLLVLCASALGLILFGCQPEDVTPDRRHGKTPGFAANEEEEHPNLDTVCKYSDSVYFRSLDGSYYVNVCNDGNFFSPAIVPCVGAQPRWGSFVMYNGYQYYHDSLTNVVTPIHYLDVDFSLAPGLYCDFSDWVFTIEGFLIIDQNSGLPQVGTDWSQLAPTDLRQEWKVRVPVAELPFPCFDMACRVKTVQLSLFEGEIPGSEVDIWAVNQFWDTPGHPAESSNEYVMHYCPLGCLESCHYLPLAWPGQLPSCVTLDAGPAAMGATYTWSTGETTRTISVCPTATTGYSVSISDGNTVTVSPYTVNVEDIRCGNPDQPQHKVWVCHIPPGNPGNPQEICIDWSGVPAHVERFRSPNSNPQLGHDSGCEIGHCGGNVCL
jgi:hypothetical protein